MPLFKVLPATKPAGGSFASSIRAEGEGAARIDAWARQIGRIHGAQRQESVAAMFDAFSGWDEGEFRFDPRTGAPISIRIPAGTDAPECVFLHEVGHYVDLRQLGDGLTPASESDPLTRAVVQAARQVPSLADSIAFVEARDGRVEARAEVQRLLSDREVFARVYTQYVAEMMRPPVARMQIARRMIQCWDAGAFPLFWLPEEFPAIGRLLHELLLVKGLIVRRN